MQLIYKKDSFHQSVKFSLEYNVVITDISLILTNIQIEIRLR